VSGYQNVIEAPDPIVDTPRNSLWEGISNIAAVIRDAIQSPTREYKFARPEVRKVYLGRRYERVAAPFVDVAFLRAIPTEERESGSILGLYTHLITYDVRYVANYLDERIRDDNITKNLNSLWLLLLHDNTLNGFSPRGRSVVSSITQGTGLLSDRKNAPSVAGGTLSIQVIYQLEANFFDYGQTARKVSFPSGPNT